MAFLFFDTSALVRRYDFREPGAAQARSLCDPSAGHTIFIAQLTGAEVASALTRKVREGQLTEERRDRLWNRFQLHRAGQYRVVNIDRPILRLAETLIFAYPLRAYDAVQLASAVGSRGLLGPQFRFCTADRMQARAAAQEGLNVEVIGSGH